ncbi:MAG TPA: Ig-like domain-containing protein [Chitinophagales bacterium]|nr:Ig-like domain-containing protein [Chitinophagales bacterium]
MSSLVALALFAMLVQSCKKDEGPTSISLVSLSSGGVDLNGVSSATGVPADESIIATFSTDVDAATATSANIVLERQFDGSAVDISVSTAGSVVTINPTNDLYGGSLYTLTIGSGLKSSTGIAFTSTSRTFTTGGAFVPDGVIAHWSFEDNANDNVGTYNSINVVNVSYNASRNTNAGKAASFDGSTSLIEIPGAPSLQNSSALTLSFWVYGDTLGHTKSTGGLKGNFVMGAGFFRGMEIEMGAKLEWIKLGASYAVVGQPSPTTPNDFFFNGDGMDKDHGGWQGIAFEKDLTASGGPTGVFQGKWAHVVITYDAATQIRNLYVNSELMESDNFNLWPVGDALTTATGLMFEPNATDLGTNFVFGFATDIQTTFWDDTDFGNYGNPDAHHFKGMLDDVRIFHRAVTADEVTAMYNSENQ